MNIPTLWISFSVILFLDFYMVIIRAAMSHARLPQMISLAAQEPVRNIDPLLELLKKTGFRQSLRLLISTAHLMLGVVGWLLLTVNFVQPPLWIGLVAAAAAALAVISIEVGLETGIRSNPEKWLFGMAGIIRLLEFILRPFSSLLQAFMGKAGQVEQPSAGMTEDELKTWVEVGESTGGLEKGERQMIYSIFHFGDTLCREIMVPRIDILALEVNTSVPEAVKSLTLSGHSRVPVYEETIDNVVGLLYAKDLLRASLDNEEPEDIRPFLRPAYFVPEAKKVDELLREMQAHSIHMAVVVDEYGGMAGMVTMEDIVEEIVGFFQY